MNNNRNNLCKCRKPWKTIPCPRVKCCPRAPDAIPLCGDISVTAPGESVSTWGTTMHTCMLPAHGELARKTCMMYLGGSRKLSRHNLSSFLRFRRHMQGGRWPLLTLLVNRCYCIFVKPNKISSDPSAPRAHSWKPKVGNELVAGPTLLVGVRMPAVSSLSVVLCPSEEYESEGRG